MSLNNRQHKDFLFLLQNHRSIRQFINKKIPGSDIEKIISATQSASSSSHGQAYSIIIVSDQDKKEKLAVLAGNQQQVVECSHFFVFCADLHRLEEIAKRQSIDMKESLESTEMFLIATIDAALAAQNTAIAAETLGYGIVYTGGIRNNPEQVCELLKLPYRTYPVFGMCIGTPDITCIPGKKPRLPRNAMVFENEYPSFEETHKHITLYDEIMKNYYRKRSSGKKDGNWSKTITDKRKIPRRLNIKSFLHDRGFPLA